MNGRRQNMTQLFFELIRLSIGNAESLSRPPSGEGWQELYDLSLRQALSGICFNGTSNIKDTAICANLPTELYYDWAGLSYQIQNFNIGLDRQCADLCRETIGAGLPSCIIKGRSVARYYGPELSLLRQSGDIDIWIPRKPEEVIRWAKEHYRTGVFDCHHIHVKVFDGIKTEVHYRPMVSRNLLRMARLQKFSRRYGDLSVRPQYSPFPVVPVEFDAILLLHHIQHHLVSDGVGMRQVMDYYFFLKNCEGLDRKAAMKTAKWLRLEKFTGALMWVLNEILGLPEEYLLCPPDEKEGRFLIEEIMKSGNMGYHDSRLDISPDESKPVLFLKWTKHSLRLIRHYPGEVLWNPIGIIALSIWRRVTALHMAIRSWHRSQESPEA